MRQFVRHPATIPIQVSAAGLSQLDGGELMDVSEGGVAFTLDHALVVGHLVDIYIPSVWPPYNGHGEVVWCRRVGCRFDVGVCFNNPQEAYKSRMVQQVCQIEEYKKLVYQSEGRKLNAEQAAVEWIEKFAAEYPALN